MSVLFSIALRPRVQHSVPTTRTDYHIINRRMAEQFILLRRTAPTVDNVQYVPTCVSYYC